MPDDEQEDYAVVIGIQHYPGLSSAPKLTGPIPDVRAFKAWLKTAGVRADRIFEVTSKPKKPPTPNFVEAQEKFRDVVRLVLAGQQGTNAAARIGRRLYIFLSGHGLEPSMGQPALLTADADASGMNHIAGLLYAQYFAKADCFEEILLFMDCCRSVTGNYPLIEVTGLPRLGTNGKPRLFQAYATLSADVAFEVGGDGASRGVFTTALLEGLRGGAAINGLITDLSLKWYIDDRFKDLTSGDDSEPQRPQVKLSEEGPIEIHRVKVVKHRVELILAPALVGKRYSVTGKHNVEAVPGGTTTKKVTLELANSRYAFCVDGDPIDTIHVQGAAVKKNIGGS